MSVVTGHQAIVAPDGRTVSSGVDLLVGMPLYSRLFCDVYQHEEIALMQQETHHGANYNVLGNIDYKTGPDIATNRNTLVSWARQRKAKYLLMIDSDITLIPKTAAVDLLWHMQKGRQVVGGLYHGKTMPFWPRAGNFNCTTGLPECLGDITPDKGGTDIHVDWVGAGFIMIDMKVFDLIDHCEESFMYYGAMNRMPYFHEVFLTDPATGIVHKLKEYLGFCLKLRQLGVNVYVDTKVQLSHRDIAQYGTPHYLAIQEQKAAVSA